MRGGLLYFEWFIFRMDLVIRSAEMHEIYAFRLWNFAITKVFNFFRLLKLILSPKIIHLVEKTDIGAGYSKERGSY